MSNKRSFMFNMVRSLAAIGIAILVATLLIFISAPGASFGVKVTETIQALRAMLISPLIRANGKFNLKAFYDMLSTLR